MRRAWLASVIVTVGVTVGLLAAPALAQTQPPMTAAQKAAAKKKYAHRPVPTTMAPPTARVTVRRSYLDAGTHVIPGDRKFTDYALPPGYSPTGVIDHRVGVYRSPLPGPFDLPGRDNPYPWNFCLGC